MSAHLALSAFGDDRVFVEKFIEGAQHIEFQVLGDGNKAIHFGERFCSIQRRHQKIIEEGPWLSDEVREEMGAKVVAGAEAVGYKGLATFEFLRDSAGEFYFLEVNPRVQVEHTVTEMVTPGLDLVGVQLRIALVHPTWSTLLLATNEALEVQPYPYPYPYP